LFESKKVIKRKFWFPD